MLKNPLSFQKTVIAKKMNPKKIGKIPAMTLTFIGTAALRVLEMTLYC